MNVSKFDKHLSGCSGKSEWLVHMELGTVLTVFTIENIHPSLKALLST